MTTIAIDLDAKTPPFEQIKSSVIELIGSGGLPVDHRMPSIRQLAGDLGVAPNTVARAYRELEAEGFVRSRGRRGTVVLGHSVPVRASDPLGDAIALARRDGMSDAEILNTVARHLAR